MIKELYLKYKEIINYLIVGVLTTVVSLTVYYGLVLTVLNPKNPIQLQAANIASWICAVAFAYWANRKFVFESKSLLDQVMVTIANYVFSKLFVFKDKQG